MTFVPLSLKNANSAILSGLILHRKLCSILLLNSNVSPALHSA